MYFIAPNVENKAAHIEFIDKIVNAGQIEWFRTFWVNKDLPSLCLV